MVENAGVSAGKAVRTFGALANAFFGTPLNNYSRLAICPLFFLLLLTVWLLAGGCVYGEEQRSRIRSGYLAAASVIFLLMMAAAYIFLFPYEEAVHAAGVRRYFGGFFLYLFLICLSRWIRAGGKEHNGSRERIVWFGSLFILLFFTWGINDRFLSEATAFNEYQIAGSEDILRAGRESRDAAKELEETDRVYFINQGTSNEYPQNVAYYELGEQVSNYLYKPWRFTEDGCEVRILELPYPTISDLPGILAEGGYTYLWVYETDDYLREAFTQLFGTDIPPTDMADGQLFRVLYSGGEAKGLEFVKQLDSEGA
jgi:hypothetical protein